MTHAKLLGAALGVVVLGLTAVPVAAQLPRLTVEGRGGAALASGATGDATEAAGGAETGGSFGVGFAFGVRGGLYAHLGFSQHRWGCPEGCLGAGDLTASGFDLALKYMLPVGRTAPFLRVGALPHTVDGSTAGPGGVTGTSDRVWGFEGGGGVAIRLAGDLWLTPGARYVTMDPDFGDGVELELRGWIVDLGLLWGF